MTEVVALEPETRLAPLAERAAAAARIPVTVIESTVETMPATEPFDAVVCSLVLCSVADPDGVLRQLKSGRAASCATSSTSPKADGAWRGQVQRVADATIWPRFAGNCHTHRDTERAISGAGFVIATARREAQFPAWVPLPVHEVALGRATKN